MGPALDRITAILKVQRFLSQYVATPPKRARPTASIVRGTNRQSLDEEIPICGSNSPSRLQVLGKVFPDIRIGVIFPLLYLPGFQLLRESHCARQSA